MSVVVTFFEETHFFSSSKQDINSIQKVLLIPSFNPVVFPIRENSNQEENHSRPPTNRAVKLSSPPPMISQHRTQGIDPTLHGESSSSCYSPLASPMTDPSSSLLHHHLLMMMTQVFPLLLRKEFGLLKILILFTLVIIVYLLHISLVFPLCLFLLFPKMFMKHLIILDGDKP